MLRAFFLLSLVLLLGSSTCDDDDNLPVSPVESCCAIAPLQESIGAAAIYVPNVFTPDFNGTNDILYIHSDDGIDQIENFTIRDRNGIVVFQLISGLPNDPTFGWDGLVQNEQFAGIYDYEFTVLTTDGMRGTFTGEVCNLPCNSNGNTFPRFANVSNCAFSAQHDGNGSFVNSVPSGEDLSCLE